MLKRHLILLALNIIMVSSGKIYGSFNLTVTDVELCRGPKHKECSVIKAQITSRNVIQYDVNVTQSVAPTKGKMIAITNGKEYLRFRMKKPCEHIFFKPILYSTYNITKDCLILKFSGLGSTLFYSGFSVALKESTSEHGRYQYSVDIQKLTQSYYGGSFLLGNYTFKSVFYSDECNFYCVNMKINLF